MCKGPEVEKHLCVLGRGVGEEGLGGWRGVSREGVEGMMSEGVEPCKLLLDPELLFWVRQAFCVNRISLAVLRLGLEGQSGSGETH